MIRKNHSSSACPTASIANETIFQVCADPSISWRFITPYPTINPPIRVIFRCSLLSSVASSMKIIPFLILSFFIIISLIYIVKLIFCLYNINYVYIYVFTYGGKYMTYQDIHTFLTIASSSSLSKAAESLFVSQPALSHRL